VRCVSCSPRLIGCEKARPYRRIAFPDSAKSAHLPRNEAGGFGAKEMSRPSFMLLIATGLVLTVYFGAAAWRVSDDSRMDITGHIPPAAR
jgi:hypothetical protein